MANRNLPWLERHPATYTALGAFIGLSVFFSVHRHFQAVPLDHLTGYTAAAAVTAPENTPIPLAFPGYEALMCLFLKAGWEPKSWTFAVMLAGFVLFCRLIFHLFLPFVAGLVVLCTALVLAIPSQQGWSAHPGVVATGLLLAGMACTGEFLRKPTWQLAFLGGLFSGLAALVAPAGIPFLFISVAFAWGGKRVKEFLSQKECALWFLGGVVVSGMVCVGGLWGMLHPAEFFDWALAAAASQWAGEAVSGGWLQGLRHTFFWSLRLSPLVVLGMLGLAGAFRCDEDSRWRYLAWCTAAFFFMGLASSWRPSSGFLPVPPVLAVLSVGLFAKNWWLPAEMNPRRRWYGGLVVLTILIGLGWMSFLEEVRIWQPKAPEERAFLALGTFDPVEGSQVGARLKSYWKGETKTCFIPMGPLNAYWHAGAMGAGKLWFLLREADKNLYDAQVLSLWQHRPDALVLPRDWRTPEDPELETQLQFYLGDGETVRSLYAQSDPEKRWRIIRWSFRKLVEGQYLRNYSTIHYDVYVVKE